MVIFAKIFVRENSWADPSKPKLTLTLMRIDARRRGSTRVDVDRRRSKWIDARQSGSTRVDAVRRDSRRGDSVNLRAAFMIFSIV